MFMVIIIEQRMEGMPQFHRTVAARFCLPGSKFSINKKWPLFFCCQFVTYPVFLCFLYFPLFIKFSFFLCLLNFPFGMAPLWVQEGEDMVKTFKFSFCWSQSNLYKYKDGFQPMIFFSCFFFWAFWTGGGINWHLVANSLFATYFIPLILNPSSGQY